MKITPKAGLLILTLVIPALIFTFLRFFARNHYDLPYFNPVTTADGRVKVVNGDTTFRQIPSICNSDISTPGKLTIVYPFEVKSADSLEMISSKLQRLEDLRTEIDNIQLVILPVESSISMSPGLDPKVWKVLAKQGMPISECINSLYGDKAAHLVLIDSQGFTRGYYKIGDAEDSDRLMAELKILQYQKIRISRYGNTDD